MVLSIAGAYADSCHILSCVVGRREGVVAEMGPEVGEGGWGPGVAVVAAEEKARGPMSPAALPCRSKADLHPRLRLGASCALTPAQRKLVHSRPAAVQHCASARSLPSHLLGLRLVTVVQ